MLIFLLAGCSRDPLPLGDGGSALDGGAGDLRLVPDRRRPLADGPPRRDRSAVDCARDLARSDGPLADVALRDQRLPDAPRVVDAPAPDRPRPDAATPDAAIPDLAAPDQRVPDLPLPDLAPCAPGRLRCGALCVDPTADPDHCGGCGKTCGAGEGCLSGTCRGPTVWRSDHYPFGWRPSDTHGSGRFVHDFSYAGYRRGEAPIPDAIPGVVVSATASAYGADPLGRADSTVAIQKALDDVGKAGGGVVLLPAGTFRVAPKGSNIAALYLRYSGVVLRGAGRHKTFLFNDSYKMRGKHIIRVAPMTSANWTSAKGSTVALSADGATRSRTVKLGSTAGFSVGQWVVLRSDATPAWVVQHGMSGIWTASNVRGPMVMRRITALSGTTMELDIPLRYPLLTRDNARVYPVGAHLDEIGLEDFSLGNLQHPGSSGWGDSDYSTAGKSAYDVHSSEAVKFSNAVNCWMRRVNSYRPTGNSKNVHVLSDGVQFVYSRNVTVEDCVVSHPQYEGGGGNGYSFVFQGSDTFVYNCGSVSARHAYSFKSLQTTGNVVRQSSSSNPRLATDFHMHLSAANLLDGLTLDRDYIDATYRPWGTTIHGHTTTQTVLWNSRGLRYHKSSGSTLVDSRQFGWGLAIGTRGAAANIRTTPTKDTKETAPQDHAEGSGSGGSLAPESLHADQLYRRLHKGAAPPLASARLVFVEAQADTFVRDGSHAGQNYGTATTLYVKDSGTSYNRIAYFRFDISKLSSMISRARLVVYARTSDGGGTHVVTSAHGVDSDSWSEKGTTWNNRPKLGPYASRMEIDNAYRWRSFDVTRFVRQQQGGDNLVSLALSQAVSGKGLVVMLGSREHATHAARLEIVPRSGRALSVRSASCDPSAASGTSAAGAVDGKLSTRWSSSTYGATLTVDLGSPQTVNSLGLAVYKGDQRLSFFEVRASQNGSDFKPIATIQAGGDSSGVLPYALPKTTARYLRLVGFGNGQSDENSVTELKVFGP